MFSIMERKKLRAIKITGDYQLTNKTKTKNGIKLLKRANSVYFTLHDEHSYHIPHTQPVYGKVI